jgi:hypothetical protein
MILALPRKTLSTALPAFAMLYMTLGHLHRQYVNYLGWDLDFTGTQMVLTMKLYMIGYNLYDGELLAKGSDNRAAKKCSKFALKDAPSLIEFLGYTFCFSNLLAGPASEYKVYLGAIDGSIFKTPSGKDGKVPSNIWPTIKPLLTSLLCLGIHLYVGGMFPLLDTVDPQRNTPAILTEEFLSKPWLYRYFYCWMGLVATRQKYYFGWKNAEGANNIWYAGFDGVDEKGEAIGWETASNMDILGFELAPDVQMMTRNWNMKTSTWLTRYVYIRTGGNLMAVYSTSAFWHGFYPGYCKFGILLMMDNVRFQIAFILTLAYLLFSDLFFLSVPLPTFCDRMAKKKLSPLFSKSQLSLYGILGTIATTVTINYMILPFVMLAGGWSLAAYKSHYFFGHIGCLVFYLALSALPSPKKEKPKTS